MKQGTEKIKIKAATRSMITNKFLFVTLQKAPRYQIEKMALAIK